MLLTRKELIDLTHGVHKSKQKWALRQMGIEYRIRPDGSIAVLRSHVETVMGGVSNCGSDTKEPDWDEINATKAQPRK